MKKSRLLAVFLGLAVVLPGCGFTNGADAVVTVIEATPTPTPQPTQAPTPTPEATPTPAPVIEQTESGIKVEVKSGTVYATSDVNVRADANTEAATLGSVTPGAALNGTGVCENGWIRVEYEGQVGYVSGDFVSTTAPEGAAQ